MLHRNLLVKAASLLLAVFLWFWVMLNEVNPITDKTVELRVAMHGIPVGMSARTKTRSVKASLRGLEQDMEDVAERTSASVSCRGLAEGEHRLAVEVRPPAEVAVVAVRPASIPVVLEKAAPSPPRQPGPVEPQAGTSQRD